MNLNDRVEAAEKITKLIVWLDGEETPNSYKNKEVQDILIDFLRRMLRDEYVLSVEDEQVFDPYNKPSLTIKSSRPVRPKK